MATLEEIDNTDEKSKNLVWRNRREYVREWNKRNWEIFDTRDRLILSPFFLPLQAITYLGTFLVLRYDSEKEGYVEI
jgi:hypothetical protein